VSLPGPPGGGQIFGPSRRPRMLPGSVFDRGWRGKPSAPARRSVRARYGQERTARFDSASDFRRPERPQHGSSWTDRTSSSSVGCV
jgi:hypothetical protein